MRPGQTTAIVSKWHSLIPFPFRFRFLIFKIFNTCKLSCPKLRTDFLAITLVLNCLHYKMWYNQAVKGLKPVVVQVETSSSDHCQAG